MNEKWWITRATFRKERASLGEEPGRTRRVPGWERGSAARCKKPHLLAFDLPCRLLTRMQTLAQDESRFVANSPGNVSLPTAATFLSEMCEKILMMTHGGRYRCCVPSTVLWTCSDRDKSFMQLSFRICSDCCIIRSWLQSKYSLEHRFHKMMQNKLRQKKCGIESCKWSTDGGLIFPSSCSPHPTNPSALPLNGSLFRTKNFATFLF